MNTHSHTEFTEPAVCRHCGFDIDSPAAVHADGDLMSLRLMSQAQRRHQQRMTKLRRANEIAEAVLDSRWFRFVTIMLVAVTMLILIKNAPEALEQRAIAHSVARDLHHLIDAFAEGWRAAESAEELHPAESVAPMRGLPALPEVQEP